MIVKHRGKIIATCEELIGMQVVLHLPVEDRLLVISPHYTGWAMPLTADDGIEIS